MRQAISKSLREKLRYDLELFFFNFSKVLPAPEAYNTDESKFTLFV